MTQSVHLDAPGQWHGQQPVSGTANPGVVKQDKSSRGSLGAHNQNRQNPRDYALGPTPDLSTTIGFPRRFGCRGFLQRLTVPPPPPHKGKGGQLFKGAGGCHPTSPVFAVAYPPASKSCSLDQFSTFVIRPLQSFIVASFCSLVPPQGTHFASLWPLFKARGFCDRVMRLPPAWPSRTLSCGGAPQALELRLDGVCHTRHPHRRPAN